MYPERDVKVGSCNYFCRGKALHIIYNDSMFEALVNQRATRIPIYSSVACKAINCFSTLFHKRNDFRSKIIERKIYISIFSTLYVWKITHSKRAELDMIKLCIGLHVKYRYFV